MRANAIIVAVAIAMMASPAFGEPANLGGAKAELMGRVEHFFMHNGRDVTWRKSLEWGEVETNEDGTISIRYKYGAKIWDKKTMVMNQVFTFAKDGSFVGMDNVKGFPKEKAEKVADVKTQKGMKELVEDSFRKNYRDITKRETIEWGEVTTDGRGNWSIRYKYRATIWDKEKQIADKIFTFDSKGDFVCVTDARESGRNRDP